MADHLEIEQKYEADAGFTLPPLDDLPGVANVSAPERQRLDATYFDTADLALIRNKVTLRRRTGGSDEGWHLKLPVRADVRQEVHEPLSSGAQVPLRLRSQVADLVGDQPLHPIANLLNERTVVRLSGPADTVLAEIADDHVTARRLDPVGGDAAAPLAWREIEVEAGPGMDPSQARDLLAATGQRLRDAGARPARSASKLARLLDDPPS
ncbi:MAG TPA: CYTH domain-containing protein [Streptosporangiaceae bacterium]